MSKPGERLVRSNAAGGAKVDDNIVTTFCEAVTPRCEAAISRSRPFATKVMGEAMAPASESDKPLPGGKNSGVGAKLSLLLALLLGCGDEPHASPQTAPAAAPPSVADPAVGITTELDGVAPEYGDAVIAELAGDETAARAAFELVLQTPDAPSPIAARSALHLAQFEVRAGKSRHALDLSARAAALAPNDAAITEGVAQVQADVVAASGGGDLLRPKAGTLLAGVEPKTADAFAAAERALVRVHAMRTRQRLEVWAKEDATEEVVAMYRAVKDTGGVAAVAADFRIGSLYRDLALGLLFSGLPEQRSHALAYLKAATAGYRASLADKQVAEAELWRLAAETDLRNAEDVLTAAGTID